ncbi:MAG: hypothetical protein GF364_17580 [Candidatus Lokiarchaeota archaeon]|nr:hypothetical protein [Candidatus Lokiarchaeota archaeon]
MILEGLAELEPRLPAIMVTFILISVMIALYIYFGFNFYIKGRRAKLDAQKSYYKGLGMYIITVAMSEGLYLFDYMNRVLYDERVFKTIEMYEIELGVQIESLFEPNYFVIIFMMLCFSLIFLAAPLEKYLLGRKRRPLTWAAVIVTPMPLIARIIEVNIYNWTGEELTQTSTYYYFTSAIWLINIGVLSMAMLVLFSQYLKMGIKAPVGSKLRAKSKEIVVGLMIWILAILTSSSVLKSIWDDGNEWLSRLVNNVPLAEIFYLMPFIIPGLLLLSLGLITAGFTRDYG